MGEMAAAIVREVNALPAWQNDVTRENPQVAVFAAVTLDDICGSNGEPLGQAIGLVAR